MGRKNILSRVLTDKSGATAVEYGLIAALIVIVMLAGLRNFATTAISMWNDIADKTSEAVKEG